MTDEEAFHAALDADPTASLTRRAFADWLEERDDPRAAGYRALGVLGVNPTRSSNRKYFAFTKESNPAYQHDGTYSNHVVPDCWYELLAENELENWESEFWKYRMNRRRAEDDAALAFARLTPEQQAAILSAAEVPA